MPGNARFDLSLINNSTEPKAIDVTFTRDRGNGDIQLQRTIELEGLNDPDRNPNRSHQTQQSVNVGRPGVYLVTISTEEDSDDTILTVENGSVPDNTELSGYVKFDHSVDLLHSIVS